MPSPLLKIPVVPARRRRRVRFRPSSLLAAWVGATGEETAGGRTRTRTFHQDFRQRVGRRLRSFTVADGGQVLRAPTAPAPPEDTACRRTGTSAQCSDESAPGMSGMRDERGWVFHPITVRPGRDLNPGQKLRKLLGYPLPYRDLFGVVLRYMSVDSINMYGSAEGRPASALRPPGMDQTRCELLEMPYRRSRCRTARGFVGPGTRFAEPRATPCSGRNSSSRLVFRMSASVFNNLERVTHNRPRDGSTRTATADSRLC